MDLTYKSHFKYGRSKDLESVFFSQIGCPGRSFKTAFTEAESAAREIYENSNKKMVLCLSGGIDSECLALSFLKAQVPFEVAILEFNNGFNNYDVFSIKYFCQRHSIKYQTVPLDVIHFFESGKYLEYGARYQCQSPQLATHLWLLDQIDGHAVIAGNFIYPCWKNEDWFFTGLPGELHCAYFRYFEVNQRFGTPWFFLYTPELAFSFFKTAPIQNQISKVTSYQELSYLEKCSIYLEAGFAVQPRADKFTGFEKVRFYYDKLHNQQFGTAFNQLFRTPLERLNPFPNEYIQIIPDFQSL